MTMVSKFWLGRGGGSICRTGKQQERRKSEGEVVSSSVHTRTSTFLWDIQGGCPGGEEVWEELRQMELEPIHAEQVIMSMWENETSRRGIRKKERSLEKEGKSGLRGRSALRGDVGARKAGRKQTAKQEKNEGLSILWRP